LGGSGKAEIYFFVDAINNAVATLLAEDGDGSVTVPASALPHGVREGDWISVSFEPAPEKKAGTAGEIDSLYGELGDDP
jgi:hypothetical protein